MRWIPVLIIASFLLSACAPGNCRRKTNEIPPHPDQKQVMGGEDSESLSKKQKENRVRVYKYDGSRQCQQGEAMSLKDMKKELEGIKVYAMKKKHDGLMHVQSCGSPTGKANVYTIPKDKLKAARKRDFKKWTFD